MRGDLDVVALALGEAPMMAGWAGGLKADTEDGNVVGAGSVVVP